MTNDDQYLGIMVSEQEAFREIVAIFRRKGLQQVEQWEKDTLAAKTLGAVVERYRSENHNGLNLQRALDIWRDKSDGHDFSFHEKYVNDFCNEMRHVHKIPDLNFIKILDLDFDDPDDRRHALKAWFHVFPHHRVIMPPFASPAKLFFDWHFCRIQFTDMELHRLVRSGFDFKI